MGGVTGLGTLLSFLQPQELRQASVSPLVKRRGRHLHPRGAARDEGGVRSSTQHRVASRTAGSLLSLFPDKHRQILPVIAKCAQMTQARCRWDTAGQPGRSKSLRQPGLTVIEECENSWDTTEACVGLRVAIIFNTAKSQSCSVGA